MRLRPRRKKIHITPNENLKITPRIHCIHTKPCCDSTLVISEWIWLLTCIHFHGKTKTITTKKNWNSPGSFIYIKRWYAFTCIPSYTSLITMATHNSFTLFAIVLALGVLVNANRYFLFMFYNIYIYIVIMCYLGEHLSWSPH